MLCKPKFLIERKRTVVIELNIGASDSRISLHISVALCAGVEDYLLKKLCSDAVSPHMGCNGIADNGFYPVSGGFCIPELRPLVGA
jgi:hypothetical protein